MGIEESNWYVGVYRETNTVSNLENPEDTTIGANPMGIETPLDEGPGDSTSEELSDQGTERSLARIIGTFFSTLRN